MTANLIDLIEVFETLWPTRDAEEWDRVGLVCGSADQKISRVLLSVDVCSEVLEEAKQGEFDLVLAHHPLILRGVTTLSEQTGKGSLLSTAIRNSIAIFSAHTNADVAEDGVSDSFAKHLELRNICPIIDRGDGLGLGRIGALTEPLSLLDLARVVASKLPSTATGVRVAGNHERLISTVALCAGAGDSLLEQVSGLDVDVYITSDLRHHVVQDQLERNLAVGNGPAIIDVSHWAAEWLWLDHAAARLSKEFPEIQFVVSAIRTDPWDFVVTQ